MPTKTVRRRSVRYGASALTSRSFVLCEDAPTGGGLYSTPKPQVLLLEERRESLIVAARQLRAAHRKVRILFEEKQIVASILDASDEHSILLTAHDSSRPVAIAQIVEALRRRGYDLPVRYCVKGKVSPEMRAAYEALTVDHVWSLPTATRSSAPEAISWINGRGGTKNGGLTILEV